MGPFMQYYSGWTVVSFTQVSSKTPATTLTCSIDFIEIAYFLLISSIFELL
jgi:hypothetical protein